MTNICKNMILLVPSEHELYVSKVPKPSISPYISKPSINMADNKAINAIKAHASCDHERALLPKVSTARGMHDHHNKYSTREGTVTNF